MLQFWIASCMAVLKIIEHRLAYLFPFIMSMKSLLYSLDSTEVSYGDNILNSVIQVNERIDEITSQLKKNQFNDFEKNETAERIQKLISLNHDIQKELEKQIEKLHQIDLALTTSLDLPRH
jgi:uncharacterized protein with PhoU and TrkA domain